MTSAETFRAREVYRYYQPRNLTEAPDASVSSPANFDQNLNHETARATNFNTQQSFSDTALTAFAQLIALRLVSQRAIVSLIDHENEYFLAESTSTLSLIGDDGPAQNAWLSISGARVPRRESLCEQTLGLVPNQDTAAEMTPWFLVPDLTLDENMSQLDCVKGPPYLRFYCGVALTNKKGVNIGCVYVVDDRPRTDFSLEQAQFLTRMAATVMDHLENIRAKEDMVRVTMMSQALHAFIEGDGTMDGDWQRLKKYNLPSGAGVGFHWETNKDDGASNYVNGKKQLGASGSPGALPLFSGPDMDKNHGQSPLQHNANNQDARFNFNNSPWSSSSEIPQVPALKSVFDGAEEANAKVALDGGRDTEFSNSGFSNLLHTTFSRASNLVREGMEVDGAVFFDAPFRFYQGRSTLETDPRTSDTKGSESSSNSSDEEDCASTRPGPRPHVIPSNRHRFDQTNSHTTSRTHGHANSNTTDPLELRPIPGGSSMGIKSDILGFSTKHSSSWNNQIISDATPFTAIDQSLLTSLVKRYPQGELFVFDQDGPISPPEDIDSRGNSQLTITTAVEEKRARHRARKRAEVLRLLVAFPGARQIFFVPLYDSTSGCFIGSFAWSTSWTRIFSIENHLSYLVAFGHSVMSEVSRLNTLSADRAKGDFISNVSHELRSPLHGILASVEFLADTDLDAFQRNLVDTVDICGRTLLDTIEHVLDFSKIKKFGQESMQSMGVVADLDISAVIEEVLEGVFAGFEFNGLSSQGLADTTRSRIRDAPVQKKLRTSSNELQFGVSNDLLTVIIDVDFREQWKFPTVPGTWRRLTMNLFGNSLKYTRSGYIKIKLEARPIAPVNPLRSDSIERTMVTLTISDSGQGMSSDFMKTKLFMPFSQEDVTAPGTGLGMSIVKQIVDLSGGRIDVRSEQNRGTEIKLSLPLENCLPELEDLAINSDPISTHEDPIDAVRRRARGRTISIHGFNSPLEKSDLQTGSLASLKASIEKYVTKWFDLRLVSTGEIADIVVSDESAHLSSPVSESRFKILLILCSNGARRDIYPTQLESGQIVEFVSMPCGPHRLAKAMLNCLDTEECSPVTPLERVSLKGSHNGEVSSEDATVTAGTSNSRLIGNLQSSIGFSPTIINQIRVPGIQTTEEQDRITRPSLSKRTSNAAEMSPMQIPSSGNTSTNISEKSSNYETPETSMSDLGTPTPSKSISSTIERRPKMLLVEDNPVNMMLLATYMKKNDWEFEKATNGLIALQAFQNSPEGFDVIFMDVSMPVMTGYESTRHIRTIEVERRIAYEHQNIIQSPYLSSSPNSFPFSFHSRSSSNSNSPSAFSPTEIDLHLSAPKLQLNRPALIIALTGFSSEKDQELAFEAGVDIFMTKPVRFREVGKILEGWMKSRAEEGQGLGKGEKEKREVDEGMSGAKRSG